VRVAVVGHVEWGDFLVCEHLPRPGEIHHVRTAHEGPGGGGSMAALALRSLTGACTFFTTVGDDHRGRQTLERLRAAGLDVEATARPGVAQRRVVTFLTDDGERAITVLGERLGPRAGDALPWGHLAGFDGVYLTAGDAGAVRAARAASVLVLTARARESVRDAGIGVDVVIGSRNDPGEAIDDELIAAAAPRYVVRTEGAAGGSWTAADGTSGRWAATPLPGPPVDAYGCGDSFAAALTAGLAAGRTIDAACALAARVGAALLTQRAPAVGDLSGLWPPRADP
jgi:ribokinase